MADYRGPIEDMSFILFDVLRAHDQWQSFSGLEDVDRATAAAILDEAAKLCEQVIAPLNPVGDEQGCQLNGSEVVSPDGFKQAYAAFNQGAWGALGGNPQYGGMGLPKALISTVEEMVQGACMAFGLAPMLTAGACLAIDAHGSSELKALYLANMISGQWSGAMDLTEPHAGTDLGLLRTKAEPMDDGTYRITGSKIFITWGEHDMAENIIHLVLARVPGAPSGSKGISMFLVPKFIPCADGSLGNRNRFACGALETKMGIKGSSTCVMNFDGATGWLVGELNQGLSCMFTMMNYERVVVGIQALAAAHWSYTNAVDYAKNRQQGKGSLSNGEQPLDDLLAHPDVRRMLMTSKAYNEGGRAFYIYVAQWLDVVKFSDNLEEKQKAERRVALLTPIAKAFLSDMAFDCAVLGQQVLGGHGFIREWGQEQLVRDIRITQIYEGTNGVQAMDLIGRKTWSCKAALLEDFLEEVGDFLTVNSPSLQGFCGLDTFVESIDLVSKATSGILLRAKDRPAELGAVAVDYLHALGHICYGYMWLKMMLVAAQHDDNRLKQGKLLCGQYYFDRLMPKVKGLVASMEQGGRALAKMDRDYW